MRQGKRGKEEGGSFCLSDDDFFSLFLSFFLSLFLSFFLSFFLSVFLSFLFTVLYIISFLSFSSFFLSFFLSFSLSFFLSFFLTYFLSFLWFALSPFQVVLLGDLRDCALPGEEVDVTGVYSNNYDAGLNHQHGFPVFATLIEARWWLLKKKKKKKKKRQRE